jgi:hypothetical protein
VTNKKIILSKTTAQKKLLTNTPTNNIGMLLAKYQGNNRIGDKYIKAFPNQLICTPSLRTVGARTIKLKIIKNETS